MDGCLSGTLRLRFSHGLLAKHNLPTCELLASTGAGDTDGAVAARAGDKCFFARSDSSWSWCEVQFARTSGAQWRGHGSVSWGGGANFKGWGWRGNVFGPRCPLPERMDVCSLLIRPTWSIDNLLGAMRTPCILRILCAPDDCAASLSTCGWFTQVARHHCLHTHSPP